MEEKTEDGVVVVDGGVEAKEGAMMEEGGTIVRRDGRRHGNEGREAGKIDLVFVFVFYVLLEMLCIWGISAVA